MTNSLDRIQSNLIQEAKKGYPILLSGCIVFLLFTFLPFLLFPIETVYLIWIFGLGVIFPFGIIKQTPRCEYPYDWKSFRNFRRNRCRTTSFLYPGLYYCLYAYSILFTFYNRFTRRLEFLPYMWIYRSKAYLFVTLSVCLFD